MGCDYYIVTDLEGAGEASGGEPVDIHIAYKRERGYFLDGTDDSDDERDGKKDAQMKRHENIRRLCSEGKGWDDDGMREKYHAIVKREYPEVEKIHSLTRIIYTRLRN